MYSPNDGNLMHVLLVEDNPGDALLILEAFKESGAACRYTVANDGEVALAMLRGEGNEPICRPDLIVLDLNLPKMNGLDVLKQLKTNDDLRSIPIIVLTSSNAVRDVSTAYDLHCNAYFCKPSAFAKYVQLTRAITDFWQKAVLYRPPAI